MKCLYCQQDFPTENPKARYCSDKCRIYHKRKQDKAAGSDAPDTTGVEDIAMLESYDVPGVDPFWTKPHKLVFHSNSEWRGCCVDVDLWRAKCPRTGDVVEAGSYQEMMSKARDKAKEHISDEVANPHWTARMPQSVKPPKEIDRSKTMLPQSK